MVIMFMNSWCCCKALCGMKFLEVKNILKHVLIFKGHKFHRIQGRCI